MNAMQPRPETPLNADGAHYVNNEGIDAVMAKFNAAVAKVVDVMQKANAEYTRRAIAENPQGFAQLIQAIEDFQASEVIIPEDHIRIPAPKNPGLISRLRASFSSGKKPNRAGFATNLAFAAGLTSSVMRTNLVNNATAPREVSPEPAEVQAAAKKEYAPQKAGFFKRWAFAAFLNASPIKLNPEAPKSKTPGFLERMYAGIATRFSSDKDGTHHEPKESASIEIARTGSRASLAVRWAAAASLASLAAIPMITAIKVALSDAEKGTLSLKDTPQNIGSELARLKNVGVFVVAGLADHMQRLFSEKNTDEPKLIKADPHWRAKPQENPVANGHNAADAESSQPAQTGAISSTTPISTEFGTATATVPAAGEKTLDVPPPAAGARTEEEATAAQTHEPSLQEQVADALSARKYPLKTLDRIEHAFDEKASVAAQGRDLKEIAYMFFYGKGGLEKDRVLAVKLYHAAAEKGNAAAKVDLAYFRYYGLDGHKADPKAAMADMKPLTSVNLLAKDLWSVWTGTAEKNLKPQQDSHRAQPQTGHTAKQSPSRESAKSASQARGPLGCLWTYNANGVPLSAKNCDPKAMEGVKEGDVVNVPFIHMLKPN